MLSSTSKLGGQNLESDLSVTRSQLSGTKIFLRQRWLEIRAHGAWLIGGKNHYLLKTKAHLFANRMAAPIYFYRKR